MASLSPIKKKRLTHLGDMPIDDFLKHYWQKQPLLIRNAFPEFESPLSADELAGLSLEDDVVSRLVTESTDNSQSWKVEHGPIPEERYTSLPESNWTLLIQHADALDPDINELLHAFRFIPNWRLDDVMVSYAPDNGGVGPHFDYYDVFLLQGDGQRRWRIGQECHSQSPFVPGIPMKILAQFDTQQDYIVNPGDLLYIPAKVAHWGEAIGESITYSIGFRAPSHADTLLDLSQELAAATTEDDRYCDPDLTLQDNSGEISQHAIDNFHRMLKHYTDDKHKIAQWLGTYSTQLNQESTFEEENWLDYDEIDEARLIKLSGLCRCVYTVQDNVTTCFINGDPWVCSLELAKNLSNYDEFILANLNDKDRMLIASLASKKYIVVE